MGPLQACHERLAGKLVLSRNWPCIKDHSVIPAPAPPAPLFKQCTSSDGLLRKSFHFSSAPCHIVSPRDPTPSLGGRGLSSPPPPLFNALQLGAIAGGRQKRPQGGFGKSRSIPPRQTPYSPMPGGNTTHLWVGLEVFVRQRVRVLLVVEVFVGMPVRVWGWCWGGRW